MALTELEMRLIQNTSFTEIEMRLIQMHCLLKKYEKTTGHFKKWRMENLDKYISELDDEMLVTLYNNTIPRDDWPICLNTVLFGKIKNRVINYTDKMEKNFYFDSDTDELKEIDAKEISIIKTNISNIVNNINSAGLDLIYEHYNLIQCDPNNYENSEATNIVLSIINDKIETPNITPDI